MANYSIFIQFSLQPLNLTSHDKDCSSEALPSFITLNKNNNQYRKEILCRFCRSSKFAELMSCKFKKIVAFAVARYSFSIIPFSQRNAKATTLLIILNIYDYTLTERLSTVWVQLKTENHCNHKHQAG